MLLLLALSLLSRPPAPADTAPPAVLLTGVTVIPATDAAPQPGMNVLVAGGRIRAISRTPVAGVPAGTRRVDARGKFLIPGLWDMHMHLAAKPLRPGPDRAAAYERNRAGMFPMLIASGVTGVRDMAGELPILTRWRDEAASGVVPGPRLVVTGRKLGNAPVVTGAPFPPESEADVLSSVRLLVAGGADFIKVDGLAGRLYPRLFQAANAAGKVVVGHTSLDLGAVAVAKMGQRSIEHLDGIVLSCSDDEDAIRADAVAEEGWWRRLLARVGLSHPIENFRRRYREMLATQGEARTDSVAAVFRTRETWQVPTLTMLRDIRLLPPAPSVAAEFGTYGGLWGRDPAPDTRWEGDTALAHALYRREVAILGRFIRDSVPILAGTDGPMGSRVPGVSLHEELALLVDAGMTPLQALQAATREPARFLGLADSLGTVEPGKVADLVLLDADPLADIHNIGRISGVFLRGEYFGPAALDSLRGAAIAALRP